jgi:cell division protein FtsB
MGLVQFINQLVHQPFRVFLIASGICTAFLLYDGSFWKWWSLDRNYKEMQKRISLVEDETRNLRFQVQEATKTSFIERQATEHLGLVREDDLVFVFTSDE